MEPSNDLSDGVLIPLTGVMGAITVTFAPSQNRGSNNKRWMCADMRGCDVMSQIVR